MTSLKDLARSLGLSVATVSRALDGYPDVAEATRQRVIEAARLAGYRPNAAARRLSKGRAEVVSLVLPNERGNYNEPLYMLLLGAIGEALSRSGFDLTLLVAPPGPDEAALYRRIVESRRADGLIVVRTRQNDPRIHYLLDARFPFVCMGRTNAPAPYAFVDGDGESAFRDATLKLAALGHRRIAHLAAPGFLSFACYRRDGYLAAMREAGLEPIVMECSYDEAGGHRAGSALLDRADPPTAIVAVTDRVALGAMRAAQERGIAVPDDLSIIGHDNIPASSFSDPPLTTMELSIPDTGRRLAEFMLARIEGKPPETLTELRPLEYIERATTAPPRILGHVLPTAY